jgi:transposase
LAYILSEGDHRKVVVREWAQQRRQTLEQVCGVEIRDTDFSDDRLGIALKHLSQPSTWQSIEQSLNRRSLRAYQLPSETIRLDATTVSGEHLVDEEGLFQFGHSKDDPSLAQVKVMLAELDPLGMPLATQVVAGEQADDGLYIPAFESVRVSLPVGLLWVGDCKIGALATRAHIHHHHHYYLMPLARTGQVPELLAQWLGELRSQEGALERVTLLKADGSMSHQLTGYVTSRVVEAKTPEGYGVCWREQVFLVHSPKHHE